MNRELQDGEECVPDVDKACLGGYCSAGTCVSYTRASGTLCDYGNVRVFFLLKEYPDSPLRLDLVPLQRLLQRSFANLPHPANLSRLLPVCPTAIEQHLRVQHHRDVLRRNVRQQPRIAQRRLPHFNESMRSRCEVQRNLQLLSVKFAEELGHSLRADNYAGAE